MTAPKNPSESKSVSKTESEATDPQAKLAELEYAIWHLGAAFSQWRRDCLESVTDDQISNTESAILHVTHMYGTAKSITEISRLLHRDDFPNIQYGLKKLARLGLIEKQGRSRKNMTYAMSERGNEVIDNYLEQRKSVLLRLFQQVSPTPDHVTDMIMQMHIMIGIYDQSRGLIKSRQP